MTGVGGFFLKGMAGGIQTGFNMGWQKKQQKMLEDKEKKITEGTAVYNNLITQLGADGAYSDDDIMQLNTAFWAAGYEVQEKVKSAHSAILTMNNNQLEQDFKWLDLAANWTEGLDPSNAKEIFEFMRSNATTDKGKSLFTAYENIYKKKYEAVQAQPTAEVFTTLEAARAKYPEAKIEFNAQAGGYVVEAGEVKPPEAPPTELDIMGETQKKLDYAYNTGNANYFNQMAKSLGVDTTFDTYKQKYEKEVGAVTPEEEPIVRTDIDYWEKTFNTVKSKDEYNRQTELLKKSKTSKQYQPKPYKEILVNKVKAQAEEIKATLLTTDSKGNVVFRGDKEKDSYPMYQQIYEKKVRELMALYPDVDMSQFPKFLPIEQIKKVGTLKGIFTTGGVSKGDYSVIDPKGW